MAKMLQIKLQSSDLQLFEVDADIIKCSVKLRGMLADLEMEEDREKILPIPNVRSAILKKIIEWATYHKDDPPIPEDDEYFEKLRDVPPWDASFFNVDQKTMFEIITSAYFLDIKGLLDVGCNVVANMIKGQTPEQIRKTLEVK